MSAADPLWWQDRENRMIDYDKALEEARQLAGGCDLSVTQVAVLALRWKAAGLREAAERVWDAQRCPHNWQIAKSISMNLREKAAKLERQERKHRG